MQDSFSDYNSSDQKTPCRRHELYVSFRELGWQVVLSFLYLFILNLISAGQFDILNPNSLHIQYTII